MCSVCVLKLLRLSKEYKVKKRIIAKITYLSYFYISVENVL